MDPVLVVGVRGGVGAAVAERMLQLGYPVVGTVRSAEQFAEVRAAIPEIFELIAVDLADAELSKQVIGERFRGTPLAGVVVCAAVSACGPLENVSLSGFRQVLEVNTISCLAIYQACMPMLRAAKGRMVMVSSHSGRVAFPFLGEYQASKFALEALGDTMRQEAADFGVKVVIVEPGGIDTAMTRNIRQQILRDMEALSESEKALYGSIYKLFADRMKALTQLLTAADVAKHVIEAFTAPNPEPRYLVGDDTKFLIERRQALTDREMDALLRSI